VSSTCTFDAGISTLTFDGRSSPAPAVIEAQVYAMLSSSIGD
jgi:hypothetical protein